MIIAQIISSHEVIGYSDDVIVIAWDEQETKPDNKSLIKIAYWMGLQLNPKGDVGEQERCFKSRGYSIHLSQEAATV